MEWLFIAEQGNDRFFLFISMGFKTKKDYDDTFYVVWTTELVPVLSVWGPVVLIGNNEMASEKHCFDIKTSAGGQSITAFFWGPPVVNQLHN